VSVDQKKCAVRLSGSLCCCGFFVLLWQYRVTECCCGIVVSVLLVMADPGTHADEKDWGSRTVAFLGAAGAACVQTQLTCA
jgi:hypothetical protein